MATSWRWRKVKSPRVGGGHPSLGLEGIKAFYTKLTSGRKSFCDRHSLVGGGQEETSGGCWQGKSR